MQEISNADFWQIAGIAALQRARRGLWPGLSLTFRGGRTDCPTSPFTDTINNIPEPDMSGEEMFAWFDEELDMTPEEVFDFS